MVKGKILWDKKIRTRDEWEKYLVDFTYSSSSPALLDTQFYDIIQSHYFAILNNKPKEIRSRIMEQVSEKLGMHPIIEGTVLGEGENCEIYRISTPVKVDLFRIKSYKGEWERDKSLHDKQLVAIVNLIGKMESGNI